MSEIQVKVVEGWGGIAAALARARAGDRVLIGPGRYTGDETLAVPSGVTLSGCPEAELEFAGDTSGIVVQDADNVVIEALRISAWRGKTDGGNESPYPNIIGFVRASACTVQGCWISSLARWGSGIGVTRSTGTTLSHNRITGGRNGIIYSSSYGTINYNECWNTGNNGIVLSSGIKKPFLRSSALIRGNLCHNNKVGGIILFSSNSDAIEQNECWSNGSCGISLERSKETKNEPSNAILRGNRCHDNQNVGIWLMSSNSEAIENNECWNNVRDGICVTRGELGHHEPSNAVLRYNRSHNNGGSGIFVSSSNSSLIEQNECWRNHNCGIDVKEQIAGLPSNVVLRSNRLFENSHCPIHFVDSLGLAEGNRFNGNGINDVKIEKSQFRVGFPSPIVRDNLYDKSLDLSSLFLPELQSDLASKLPITVSKMPFSTEGLASFLTSGCSHCFRTFWTGVYHASEPHLASHTVSATQFWRLIQSQDEQKFELVRLTVPQGDLTAMLVNNFMKNRGLVFGNATGKVNWSAAVISDDRDAEEICDALNASVNTSSADYVQGGGRVGAPVKFDMTVDDASLRDRLSRALMGDKSRGVERMKSLTKVTFIPALLFFSIAAGIWLSPWFTPATNWLAKLDIWVWLTGFASLIASISFLDLLMPRHLRAGSGLAETISFGIKRAFGSTMEALFDALARIVPESRRNVWADRADLQWQRKKLFGNADIATLYLSDVTRWRDGDLAWLEALGGSLTENQKLNVLIELDGRLSLRPLLLESNGCPWRHGIELYLFDDVDKLRLRDPRTASGDESTVDISILGARDDADVVRNELLDDLWCPTDLLPTLPIASAPTQRLRLENRLLQDTTQLSQSDLVKQTFPAAQKLFTSEAIEWKLDPNSFWRPFELAKKARALQTSTSRNRMGTSESIAGRAGYRREVATLLRGIWTREESDQRNLTDWREYVVSSLRFGIWHGLTEVAKVLAAPISPHTSLQVRRALEAVRFLGEDLQAILVAECPLHGEEEVYQPAWSALRAAMEILVHVPDGAAVVGAWLGAEETCLGALPPKAEELLKHIEDLFTDPTACHDARATTAVDAFCITSARQLIDLQQLDPRSREQMLARFKATMWRGFPNTITDRFVNWANGRGANSRSLAMLFANAKDVQTIETLIRMHSRNPVRTVYALANAATNHIIADNRENGASLTFDERMPLVAKTLMDFRNAWIDTQPGNGTQLPRDFAMGASGAAMSAHCVYEFMTAHAAAKRIAELVRLDSPIKLEDLEGNFELELVAF